MAQDRFINFNERRPSRAETESVLRHFIGDAGVVVWDAEQSRFMIHLVGSGSFPFIEIAGVPEWSRTHAQYHPDGRWIEVMYTDTQFDVLTRQQDEYTNAVADGIARAFARFWNGHVDHG